MKRYEKLRAHPMVLVSVAVGLALLLVTALTLSLSARAEPANGDPVVNKWVNVDQASPGDLLTYTIHIIHNGEYATLWMTDTLPPELTYVDDSLHKNAAGPGSVGYANGVISWTSDSFGYGKQVYITFTAEISPDLVATTVVNTAEVTGTGTLVPASASTVVSSGELQASKEAAAQASPGDMLTYTVHIVHNGPETSIWMTDTLPPELTYVDSSLQKYGPGSADYADGVVTWTALSFGSGSWVYITFTVEISPDLPTTTLVNTATITGPGISTFVSASTEISSGELQVSKEASASSVRSDEQLGYTIRISNTGEGAVSVVSMVDSLPPEVSYASGLTATGGSGASWGVSGDVVTWTGRLEPSEGAKIDFAVDVSSTLSEGTFFTNTVTVSGAGRLISDSVAVMVKVDYEYLFPLVAVNYPPVPVIDSIPALQEIFTVTWDCAGCEAVADHFVLQEATDADFTQDLTAYTLTQTFLPMDKTGVYGVFYYRVRADDGWGQGPWSNVEMANISPPAVVLDPFPVPDVGTESYWVTWDCGGCETAADQFVIQESTGDDFTSDVVEYTATGTSLFVDNSGIMDNLYYRVRADGGWGQGSWSNVEMVNIPFYDDFSDSNSGWPDEEGLMYVDESGKRREWKRDYKDGEYRLLVEKGGPLAWFWHPAAWAPYKPYGNKYCIETKVKFSSKDNYWANMGVIFGSEDNDENEMKIYAFCLGADDDSGLGWFLIRKDQYQFPHEDAKKRGGCAQPDQKIESFAPEGQDVRAGTSKDGWNRIRIGVDGNYVRVYIGDYYKGRKRMSGLNEMKYVGVIGGDYEITPTDVRYEYYQVIPESSCDY